MQIKINSASFGYNGEDILENFSFEVNDSDKIAIIGKNGSGRLCCSANFEQARRIPGYLNGRRSFVGAEEHMLYGYAAGGSKTHHGNYP